LKLEEEFSLLAWKARCLFDFELSLSLALSFWFCSFNITF